MSTTSLAAKADAATVSELLLNNVTLGDGIISPFPETRGLVFSSATPYAAFSNLREAERTFLVWADLQRKAERDELERLEAAETAPVPSVAVAVKRRTKELKEKLALYPYVTWRDTDTMKRDMVEILRKSSFNAMSFVDEFGARLAKSYASRHLMAADFGWINLTEGTSEVALIRSSASGGCNVHSLGGDTKPKLNYFSHMSQDLAKFMLGKALRAKYASAAGGRTIIIPGYSADNAQALYSKEVLAATLRRVFSKGGTAERLAVTFESPELKADWDKFLAWDLEKYHSGTVSAASAEVYKNMPARPMTLSCFASKAAMTMMVLDAVGDAELVGAKDLKLVLTSDHLAFAKDAAVMIFKATSGVDRIERRGSQHEKARKAFTSPARVCAAEQALYDAITLAPDRKISHEAAIRTPGVTAGLLELLVARDHRFVELKGVENIGMGKTKRAYMLKADVRMDTAEAVAEFEAAAEEWDEHGAESVDESDVRREFKTLQDLATKRRYRADGSINYAAVPIDEMTPKQIRLVPAIASMFADEVCLRGTWEMPEPGFLLEADEDDPAAFTKGIPNLWFRYNSKLEEQHNWTMAWKLGFAEAWGKPLGQVKEI
jgi:hypothetical protein